MNHLRLNATLPRLKAKVNAMRHVDSLNVIGLGGGGGGGVAPAMSTVNGKRNWFDIACSLYPNVYKGKLIQRETITCSI